LVIYISGSTSVMYATVLMVQNCGVTVIGFYIIMELTNLFQHSTYYTRFAPNKTGNFLSIWS